ncbi:iron reductase domain protein [Xylaria bambusicola]|uniref:iron reductase domain protein n=1 Tax=Xylaria bambusicola TaxID=326684 RepID=UPI002008696C|nr:iron reductase domain protein [Xylaria bambusicola]KAI0526034.1 iron reductase domain protein [Xylaria bambusicola]
MMQQLFTTAALSALTYGAFGTAATVSRCPTSNVCYQVGVPEASASSAQGNIYMQLRAPTTYSWVALGTGQQMRGANIFVMYANGDGNVTVSPRYGTGHSPPQPQSDTHIKLLAGSGIVDNGQTMVANIQCSNCESWNGGSGSLDLTDTSANFIAAWKGGNALNSNSLDASISIHDSNSQFTFDLTQATIASDGNPFVNAGEGTTPPSGNTGSGDGSSSVSEIPKLASAHGIIMSIVMVVLYPIGSVLMPLFGSWMLHGVWQIGSFLVMWAGFAVGVILAQRTGIEFGSTHTLLGTVVVALFGVQPIGGYLHHLHYVKHQKRGLVSHGHIWYGRVLLVLGIVNGGLGLELASADRSLVIAYSVVAAVLFAVYVGGAIFGEVKRARTRGLADRARKNSSE